jgi:hypothetical protein
MDPVRSIMSLSMLIYEQYLSSGGLNGWPTALELRLLRRELR